MKTRQEDLCRVDLEKKRQTCGKKEKRNFEGEKKRTGEKPKSDPLTEGGGNKVRGLLKKTVILKGKSDTPPKKNFCLLQPASVWEKQLEKKRMKKLGGGKKDAVKRKKVSPADP